MLSDMGAALDWFHGLYLKNGWKSIKMVMGPMWYILVCLHPDTAKVILKGGRYSFPHSPTHPFTHSKYIYVLYRPQGRLGIQKPYPLAW